MKLFSLFATLTLSAALAEAYQLVTVPAELKGFSAFNPPRPDLQCGEYSVSLHITDEVENAMRVGYMFVDGRIVKGGYHSRGIYGTFAHPKNGNNTGEPDYATKDPWYYFRAEPSEGWLRVLVLEDGTEIKCDVIEK